MHGEKVVLMSRSINILIDSGRENSASFYRRGGSCFWLFSPWSLIGHALRPIFMLWLLKIWQVSSRRKFLHYLETCLVIAEADSLYVILFLHKMKGSCYQDSFVIHGWFVYWVFGWEMRRFSKSSEIRFLMASF